MTAAGTVVVIRGRCMVRATRQVPRELCSACFTGEYPIPLPAPDSEGRELLGMADKEVQK